MTDPLASVRAALADVSNACSESNLNIQASLSSALRTVLSVDLTPPPPVLRIVKADPTGAGDATNDIQAALDGAGIIYLPAGTYLIDPAVSAKLRSLTTVICHKDAQFKLKPNGLERYYGLLLADVTDVQIIGGAIRGDRLLHTYGPNTNEHGMGIDIQRCARVHISDMLVEQCTGDGISAYGNDLTFDRVISTGNRRQGLSIYAGSRYRILGGEYSHSGNMGTNLGTAPMAGIDIEQDAGDVDDVLLDGVSFAGNQTAGLLVWTRAGVGSTRNVRAVNCSFDGDANGIDAKGLGGPVDITVTRSSFNKCHGSAVKAESGSTINVGTSDQADANTIVGMGPRTPATTGLLHGIKTKYDLTPTGTAPLPPGVINAGWNQYA